MLLQNNDGTLWINLSTVHLAEYASDLSNAKLPRLLKTYLVDQNKRGRALKATKFNVIIKFNSMFNVIIKFNVQCYYSFYSNFINLP